MKLWDGLAPKKCVGLGYYKGWWCGEVNSNKMSYITIEKIDLNIYNPSSSNKHHKFYAAAAVEAVAAITSNSNSYLSQLTS